MMPKDLSIAEVTEVGVYKIAVGGVEYYKLLRMRKRRYGKVSYYDREVTRDQAIRIKVRLLALGARKVDNGYKLVYVRRIGSRQWGRL